MDGRLARLGVAAFVVLLGAWPTRAEGPGRHDPRHDAQGDPRYAPPQDADDAWSASQGDDDEREAPPDDQDEGADDDEKRLVPAPRGEAPDQDGDDDALPTEPAASLPGGARTQPLAPPPEESEEPAPRGLTEEPLPSGPMAPEAPAAAAAAAPL